MSACCARCSGPPVIRTLFSGRGWATTRPPTRGAALDPRGSPPNGAIGGSAALATVAAEAWRKVRRSVILADGVVGCFLGMRVSHPRQRDQHRDASVEKQT